MLRSGDFERYFEGKHELNGEGFLAIDIKFALPASNRWCYRSVGGRTAANSLSAIFAHSNHLTPPEETLISAPFAPESSGNISHFSPSFTFLCNRLTIVLKMINNAPSTLSNRFLMRREGDSCLVPDPRVRVHTASPSSRHFGNLNTHIDPPWSRKLTLLAASPRHSGTAPRQLEATAMHCSLSVCPDNSGNENSCWRALQRPAQMVCVGNHASVPFSEAPPLVSAVAVAARVGAGRPDASSDASSARAGQRAPTLAPTKGAAIAPTPRRCVARRARRSGRWRR